MIQQHKESPYNNQLWQKRKIIFLMFLGYTIFVLLTLTIPFFYLAGSGLNTTFFKFGFFIPVFGFICALSSLTSISPIYKTTKEDQPVLALFGILFILLPIFGHLDAIQGIQIADSIWTIAWSTSLFLAILSGVIFFRRVRKNYILLGGPIILSILATAIGGLFGAILFKLVSWIIV